MSLPQFAPFPEAQLRQSILPQEWELYLDSWSSLADLYLRLNYDQFRPAVSSETSSLTHFLISLFHEAANDDSILSTTPTLRKKCFHLLHRILSGDDIPPELLKWTVLSDICRVFLKSEQLRSLLANLWKRKATLIEKNFQLVKNSLIKNLESKMPESAEDTLNRVVPLLKVSPDAGTYLLTGSDFLDALCSAYPKVSFPFQTKLATTAYLGLTSLLEGSKPSYSVLSDHLYSLKTSGEQQQKSDTQKSLVADLVTNTPFLNKVRDKTTAPEAARVKNFAASLNVFQQTSLARPKKLIRRKVDKGKGTDTLQENGHQAFGDVHVHRMSLISQIQDLFPDLGSGFVAKLLHEYNDNVEETTAHLLEDSLPSHLASANRSEQLYVHISPNSTIPRDTTTNFLRPATSMAKTHFTPRSTPPPSDRRNAFDNDEFDRLTVDTSRLHLGRKNQQLTADKILQDRKAAPSKSAILSALAAFDSDDDERDDTYDVEDVGGTIDAAASDDTNFQDKNEEALFKAYSASPELFGRDATTRRGNARTSLKTETGMSDEQIEGWGLMIGRDPKRMRRLEAKFSHFSGQQTTLAPTAWRNSPAGSEGEGAGSGDGQRGGRGGGGRGRGRGRGRGGGGGGGGGRGGGNVAGPADDKGTQAARQRKDQNKGSRANHNRRDQRARKMARGGLAG
ncbi:hypothetical protein P280DRAFT_494227 [Massarina eburnea CBS 473.64]|uniref:CUE domain-containing protein n=1 Tax=Massarina eburnea CBS 473.64 TaxID=1395130 RepID=A0A6A6RH85_9PLEO|nr:hypothetical protein P280DRAFT_494227 [Massarina eburnea CBS 473.64]